MEYFILYRSVEFWSLYPDNKHTLIISGVVMYLILYILNIFWFSKIAFGLFKAFGLDKALEYSSYEYDDYAGYFENEQDE